MLRQVLVLAALLAAVHGAAPSTNAVNTYNPDGTLSAAGAVSSCTATEDMFPDKASVDFANFQVDYKKNYKRVVNTAVTPNKVYILYQRGCTAPTTADAGPNDGIFAVPLTGIKADSSTYLPWFEYMGDRGAVVGLSGALYSASPCMWKMFNADQIKAVGFGVEYTNGQWLEDADFNSTTPLTPTNKYDAIKYTMAGVSSPTGPNPIVVSDILEKDYYSISEWIEYIGLFMNREKTVNEHAKASRQRWLCHSKAANENVVKKKVLWATYYNVTYDSWTGDPEDATAKGWEVRKCDHTTSHDRHCKLITAAGGLPAMEDVSKLPEAKKKRDGMTYQGMTAAEMMPFLENVDVIIFGSTYCDGFTVHGDYSATVTGAECEAGWKKVLEEVSNTDEAKISPAVKNDQVYDIGRILDPAGTTDFNAGAHLEPDVVLEDYIHILYPESNPEHKLVWLRNFNEGAGLSHKCADDAAKVGCSKTATELAGACSDSSVLHTIKADDCSTATATRAPTLLSLLLGALLVLASRGY